MNEELTTENSQPQENTDFSWALNQLKRGRKIARNGWNGKGTHIEMQAPDENSKMTLPYVFMKTATDDLVPWLCNQTDMMADDWVVIL